jgi:thioredoxin 1
MINIQSTAGFEAVLRENRLVLVDFYADWCEPCKFLDEVLARLEPRLDGMAIIAKVNTDAHPELSKKFTVLSVPVLAIFVCEELKWRMNGFKMEEDLLAEVLRFRSEKR